MSSSRRFALLCGVATCAWVACIIGFLHVSRPKPVAAASRYTAPTIDVVPVAEQPTPATAKSLHPVPDLQIAAVDVAKSQDRRHHRHRRHETESAQKPAEPPAEAVSYESAASQGDGDSAEPAPEAAPLHKRESPDSLTRAFERENAV